MKLYKYRRMASLGNDRIFARNEIYFSSARDFNDPFDCRPCLKTDFTDDQIRRYSSYLVKKKFTDRPHADRHRKATEIRKRMKRPWELEQLSTDVQLWSLLSFRDVRQHPDVVTLCR